MGLPGIAVALCFATASILLRRGARLHHRRQHPADAGRRAAVRRAPRLRCSSAKGSRLATWVAIAAVICGVAIMVSESFDGSVSPIGDGLALLIAVAFSIATVITRRFAHVAHDAGNVPRHPDCRGFCAPPRRHRLPSRRATWRLLFAFGALNLGLGLACFATGARLIPAAFAALLGTFETVLGAGLGLADPWRDAVGAHDRRRRRHLHCPARPYRAGVPAHVAGRSGRA